MHIDDHRAELFKQIIIGTGTLVHFFNFSRWKSQGKSTLLGEETAPLSPDTFAQRLVQFGDKKGSSKSVAVGMHRDH